VVWLSEFEVVVWLSVFESGKVEFFEGVVWMSDFMCGGGEGALAVT
jgi:hypothetical protein